MPPRSAAAPAAALLAVGVLVVAWAGLYRGDGAGRLLALGAVAALPALAARVPRHRTAALAAATAFAVVTVACIATRSSPWDLLTLDDATWAQVGAILPDGLREGSDAGLPVLYAETPALVGLLDVALAALCAGAAWQIAVRGRPVAAVVIIGVGLAYRWTVEPPASGGGAAVLALVALAAILALATWDPARGAHPLRRATGATVLGGVAVAIAAGLGSGPAQAGEGWWEWRQWEFGGGTPAAASLDIRQGYGTLDWPSTPRVALTVAASSARPIRAVGLDVFDGEAFTVAEGDGSEAVPIAGGAIRPPHREGEDAGNAAEIVQRIRLVGARTPLVLASGRIETVVGPFAGTADLVGDALRVRDPLGPGDSYVLRARLPMPDPADLVAAPGLVDAPVPAGATLVRAAPGARSLEVPYWGSGQPGPSDAELGAYAPVRTLARRVAGDAKTEYAAVNHIEAFLRGRYIYDEAPPYPAPAPDGSVPRLADAPPPLADFLLRGRRGFCQHFAGSMALMLRTVGIPARVAVGYTGGHFDAEQDRYVVLDRDAHSWVEVWFPGYGWLPFDPTPDRAASNPASVSSPDYAPSQIQVDLAGLVASAVAPGTTQTPNAALPELSTPDAAPNAAGGDDVPAPAEGGSGGWWWLLVLAPLALLGVGPGLRAARRARLRRAGDERARVIAAARELEASLARLGVAPPASASPTERAAAVRARTGVDPSAIYARAARARYAPEPPAPGEGAAAWREAGAVLRAVRRRAPLRTRLVGGLGLRLPRRGTVRA